MPNDAETSQYTAVVWVTMLHCCIRHAYGDHYAWIQLLLIRPSDRVKSLWKAYINIIIINYPILSTSHMYNV